MTAYLDNNIIVSIENGDYSFDQIKALLPETKTRFFYSSAHIFEVESFQGNSIISKEDLLSKRFDTVRTIFKNNYLYLDLKGNKLTHIIEDPQEVYDTITLVPFGIDAMKGFMNLFSKEQKEDVRQNLGIEMQKINNYSATEVIEHLNTKLTNWGTNQSFLEMIEHGIQLHPDGKKIEKRKRQGDIGGRCGSPDDPALQMLQAGATGRDCRLHHARPRCLDPPRRLQGFSEH